MRPITQAERDLLGGNRLGFFTRLLVADADGVFHDMTDAGGIGTSLDWLGKIRRTRTIDDPVATVTVELRREALLRGTTGLALSLAPMLQSSPLNRRADGTYAPLLDVTRAAVIDIAVVPPGTVPAIDDWREIFRGEINAVPFASDPIVLTMRDQGARLQRTQIETVRTYGSDTGVPVETVIQQLLNDNNCSDVILTLGRLDDGTPDSPGFMITTYEQGLGSVMDAAQTLAQQSSGWTLRYQYDTDGIAKFMLLRPDRAKTAPDVIFGPDEYTDITQAEIADADIRNAVTLWYTDKTTGARMRVDRQDDISIARYDRRWMQLAEDATSNIDSDPEGIAMADAALSDLAYPALDHTTETFFFWPLELNDLARFLANGVHYDTDQDLAVISITDELDQGHGTTTIGCRGKPAGGYQSWLDLDQALQPPLFSGPSLVVRVAKGDAEYTITWSGDGVQLAIDGGAPGTPPESPIVVPRGNADTLYEFSGTKNGQALVIPVNVPAAFRVGPEISFSLDKVTGALTVFIDGRPGATKTYIAVRTDRYPKALEIVAGVVLGPGVQTGSVPNVATIPPHSKFFIGAISENAIGTRSDPAYVSDDWLGVNATPAPTVTFGTPDAQTNEVTLPVVLSATAQRVEFFVVESPDDLTPGSSSAQDVEGLAADVCDWVERKSDGTYQPSVSFPVFKGGDWIIITGVVTDALRRRGPSASLKVQSVATPPTPPPNPATLGAVTATANSLTVPATLPASGTAPTAIRPYLDNVPLTDVVVTAAPGAVQTITFGNLTPNSSHQLAVRLVSAGGLASDASNAVIGTTTGDTSGGGGGTGSNGKLPIPLITGGTFDTFSQSVLLDFTPGGTMPNGTTYSLLRATSDIGEYIDVDDGIVASPAAYTETPGPTPQMLYYKLVAKCAGYADSDAPPYANTFSRGVNIPSSSGQLE